MAYGINIFDGNGSVIFTGDEPTIIVKGKFTATKESDGSYAFDDGLSGQVAVKIPVGATVSGVGAYNSQSSVEYIRFAPATDVVPTGYGLATYSANGQTVLTDAHTPLEFVNGTKITTTTTAEENTLSGTPADSYIHFGMTWHTIWRNDLLNDAPIFVSMTVERTTSTNLLIKNVYTGPGLQGQNTRLSEVIYRTQNNCIIAFKES